MKKKPAAKMTVAQAGKVILRHVRETRREGDRLRKSAAEILDGLHHYAGAAMLARDAIMREGVQRFCQAAGVKERQPLHVWEFYDKARNYNVVPDGPAHEERMVAFLLKAL